MRILVTGSSGWLGQTLVPRLRRQVDEVIGLDPVPSPHTQIVGSVADRETVRRVIHEFGIDAIVHGGALHKPNIQTHNASDFMAVNVQGTLNLLEEAVAPGSRVDRFIFTSTTSLMISREIRAGASGGLKQAVWITEEMAPLLPRNIYGVSKLSAEHICRLFHELHRLPVIILRTSRFFPEEDDMADMIVQSEPNTKANEFLFRRLTVEDAAESHVLALAKASALGFDTFIISARTPFSPDDCKELIRDAPSVVARYFPDFGSFTHAPGGRCSKASTVSTTRPRRTEGLASNAASASEKSWTNSAAGSISPQAERPYICSPAPISLPKHAIQRS